MEGPSKTKGWVKHNHNNMIARSDMAIWILYMVRASSNILSVESLTAESFFNRMTGLYIWLACSMGDFRDRRSDSPCQPTWTALRKTTGFSTHLRAQTFAHL